MAGATIEAPCINQSTYLTNIQGTTIYIGLIHIAELERKVAYSIVKERNKNGDFRSLKDFINRMDTSRDQIEILIRIGAFRFTGMNKYALMWEKNALYNPMVKQAQYASLFEMEEEEYDLPILQEGNHDQAFDEIELLGFPLCSPFELVAKKYKCEILAKDLTKAIGSTKIMIGYYVTRKHVTTVNGKHMNFGTWLDEEGQFFDTTHFPPSLAKYPFLGRGVYIMKGKIVEDFGFPSMEVTAMEKLPYVKDDRWS
jgi:DNA polymerase-3 subunit alpha